MQTLRSLGAKTKKVSLKGIVAMVLTSMVLMLVPVTSAHAETVNILLTPNKKETFANPGDIVRGSVKVRNNSFDPLTNIVAEAKDFTANDNETGDPRIIEDIDENYTFSLASWIEFDSTPVTIPPEDSVEFNYVINVPEDAEPGGHYGLIKIRQVAGAEGQNAVGIQTEIASLILLTVSGDIDVSGEIVEFYTGKKLYEYLPADFYLRVKNDGNVHFSPTGSIFITDMFDRVVGTLPVNEQAGAVLPESIRRYQNYWNEAFMVDEYVRDPEGNILRDVDGNRTTELKVNWNQWNLFRLGQYNARAVVVYEDENREEQQLVVTTTFWVVPWKMILGVVLGIILLALVMTKVNKWYSKRLVRRYEKGRKEAGHQVNTHQEQQHAPSTQPIEEQSQTPVEPMREESAPSIGETQEGAPETPTQEVLPEEPKE